MIDMTKNGKKKYNFTFLIIGLVLFLIALLINKSSVIRLLLTLVGVGFVFYTFKRENRKINVLLIVLFIICSIFIDSIVSSTLVRIPIFAYNITTSGNTRVYKAIGYRIWQCDKNSTKNMKVDKFYTKGYSCDASDIETIDSNSFLNSVIENYDDYKDTYVKIKGKISKKNSRNSIEMQPYEQSNITLNGYVTFADNITLKILFYKDFDELDLYDIYDEIIVVGVVKTLEHNDDKFVIYLTESIMISASNFDKYEMIVNEQATCENGTKNILYSSDEYDLYAYCLEDVFVNYGENKYELSSALSSGKISIDELFAGPIESSNLEDGSELYKFEKYSVLKCNKEKSKDIVIAPKTVDASLITCNPIVTENEENTGAS